VTLKYLEPLTKVWSRMATILPATFTIFSIRYDRKYTDFISSWKSVFNCILLYQIPFCEKPIFAELFNQRVSWTWQIITIYNTLIQRSDEQLWHNCNAGVSRSYYYMSDYWYSDILFVHIHRWSVQLSKPADRWIQYIINWLSNDIPSNQYYSHSRAAQYFI
jgi:hypothetical protein